MPRSNTAPSALRAMLEAERADNLRWNTRPFGAARRGAKAAGECVLALGLAAVLIALLGRP